MRLAIAFLSAALTGTILLLLFVCQGSLKSPENTSPPAGVSPALEAEAPVAAEILALRARIAELEAAAVKSQEPWPPPVTRDGPTDLTKEKRSAKPGALLDPGALGKLVDEKDVPRLRVELEKLLAAGEGGFRILLEFLRSQAGPPRFALRQDSRLSFTLLSLGLEHEDRAAEFCRFLLGHLDAAKDSALRQQLFRFLPNFIAYLGDRQPRLRQAFEETLAGDLDHLEGGAEAWQSLEAMEQSGLEVPVESLEAMLSDPSKTKLRPYALQQLSKRGDDASLNALLDYLVRLECPKDPGVWQIIQALSRMQNSKAQAQLEGYLTSPVKELREAATLGYFSKRRGLDSLPIVADFLGSDADQNQKNMLVWQLGGSSPELFEALKKNLASLPPEVGKTIQVAATQSSRQPGGARSQVPANGAANGFPERPAQR